MSRSYVFRTQARADVLEQEDWYISELAFDIAERFVTNMIETAQYLLDNPGVGRVESTSNLNLAGLQSYAIKGFESLRIYYILSSDGIDIIRVLHSARDIDRILNDET